jgi:hypothetical protein
MRPVIIDAWSLGPSFVRSGARPSAVRALFLAEWRIKLEAPMRYGSASPSWRPQQGMLMRFSPEARAKKG